MSLSRDDEETVAVRPLMRDGPDLPPPASTYVDEADGEQYLFVVEDSSCTAWLASTESTNLADCV